MGKLRDAIEEANEKGVGFLVNSAARLTADDMDAIEVRLKKLEPGGEKTISPPEYEKMIIDRKIGGIENRLGIAIETIGGLNEFVRAIEARLDTVERELGEMKDWERRIQNMESHDAAMWEALNRVQTMVRNLPLSPKNAPASAPNFAQAVEDILSEHFTGYSLPEVVNRIVAAHVADREV